MEIIQDFNILDTDKINGTVVTIGNFDGLHKGHKMLIDTVCLYANKLGMNSIIVTFAPHPTKILMPHKHFSYIFTDEEKECEMKRQNIDYLIKYPFTEEFSNLDGTSFVKMIKEGLNCKILVVGSDYSFGKNKVRGIDALNQIAQKFDIEIIEVKDILNGDKRISSTYIKELIQNRQIKKVNELLGKKYFIRGKVVEGNKLGRTIGFPTANIIPHKNKYLPQDGVYITTTKIENKMFNSITNVGTNPTVNNKIKTVETNIFDFEGNLYDETIEVYFLDFIREVKKFDNIQDLKLQITKDTNNAKKFFNSY